MDEAATDVATWLASGKPLDTASPPRRIDTHGAVIVLTADRAWKVKRPVRYPYLDFSTVEKRHAALAEELRLNRRTAPGLYIGLHPVARRADGSLVLDGTDEGDVVDWVLEMRRFPDAALLALRADREGLDDALLLRLTDGIVAFHSIAAIHSPADGAARLARVIEGNARSMAGYPGILPPDLAARLNVRLRALLEAHAGLLDQRARDGFVRHCHGDLHLGNIAVIDAMPTPFDCLEFDAELATTDVLYDLAFLLMDLWQRGLRHQANLVFNRYFDLAGANEPGVALMPMLMAVRATVRAHVLAAQASASHGGEGTGAQARAYLDLALALVAEVPPRLVAIGGLSGTGKSTLARMVGGEIGRAPGARVLRSDVLRKRLAGVPPETHLPAQAYTPDASVAVYAELERLARRALSTGHSAVADAVFGTPGERAAIAGVARAGGQAFTGIWLTLGEGDRLRRVEERGADASDADAAVVRMQSRALDGPVADWAVFDTSAGAEAVAGKLAALLRAPPVDGQ